jgi:hypothetical protein
MREGLRHRSVDLTFILPPRSYRLPLPASRFPPPACRLPPPASRASRASRLPSYAGGLFPGGAPSGPIGRGFPRWHVKQLAVGGVGRSVGTFDR